MTVTFGSLFSGIGGFDLGFERAGMKCLWQCEIDKKASEVLAKHWPDVRRYEDVRTIGKHNLEPVDVICGGFPCQDLSIAGKRKGLDGERSGLWFEFARIIDELEPRWVVIENVPGLLSSSKGEDFAVILRWLVERGYGVCWRILDAQYFGVAQRRRRVFIVASFGNGDSAKVLFESDGVRWDPPSRGKAGEGIAGTLDGKSCASNRGSQANELEFLAFENRPADSRITETGDISQQLTSRMGTGGGNVPLVMAHGQGGAEIVSDGSPSLTCNHEQPIVFNDQGGSQMSITKDVTATLRSQEHGHQPIVAIGHSGGVTLKLNAVSNSLNGQTGSETTAMFNGVLSSGVRRLTPTECERLQGFPDGWTDGQPDSARYKQLGNAVAVPVANWIGRRINA